MELTLGPSSHPSLQLVKLLSSNDVLTYTCVITNQALGWEMVALHRHKSGQILACSRNPWIFREASYVDVFWIQLNANTEAF